MLSGLCSDHFAAYTNHYVVHLKTIVLYVNYASIKKMKQVNCKCYLYVIAPECPSPGFSKR